MKPTNISTEDTANVPADNTANIPTNVTTNVQSDISSKILVVGSINMDYVLQTERLPLKGETLPAKNFIRVFGGKGMNQTVAMKRLGASPVMVGCLGKDADGNALMEGLRKESLSTSFIYRSENVSTGIAFITVSDEGDNTIVVSPGSNHDLSEDWVTEAINRHRDAAMLVLQMEIPLKVVQLSIEKAYEYGIPVVLNPSPFKELPAATLKKVHTLVVNEVEAEQIAAAFSDNHTAEDSTKNNSAKDATENDGPGSCDSKALAALLAKSRIPRIILTKGAEGVYYNAPKQGENTSLGEDIRHLPAKKVQVVDPTAAGDSFLGAYAAGLCRGYSVERAISRGILAGALAVTKAGAQPSIPDLQDLKDAGWKE